MSNNVERDWYQTLVDNPDITVDEMIKIQRTDSVYNMLANDKDIAILKDQNLKKIQETIEKIDCHDGVKTLMKAIFKK